MDINDNDKDEDERNNPFDNFKKDREFERMIRDIEQMMRESLRDIAQNKMEPGNSYVHGFNINISPEGKAEVKEFGNYPKKSRRKQKIYEEKEPSIDIIEDKSEVTITILIPGIEKEDIDINVVNKNLEIKVNTAQCRYHKRIPLPCKVKPKKTKATYKNGVLDITIEKKDKSRKDNGYSVNIK